MPHFLKEDLSELSVIHFLKRSLHNDKFQILHSHFQVLKCHKQLSHIAPHSLGKIFDYQLRMNDTDMGLIYGIVKSQQ